MKKEILVAVILTATLVASIAFVSNYFFQQTEVSSNVGEVWLRAVLELPKTRYQVGEEIFVEPRLINIGKRSTTIHHADPLFFVEVYDAEGNRVLTTPTLRLDIRITYRLRPNEPYFFHRVGYEFEQVAGYNFTPEREGVYRIVAYAEFSIEDYVRIDEMRLYTKPIRVEVSAK